jgi:hypothetical protein
MTSPAFRNRARRSRFRSVGMRGVSTPKITSAMVDRGTLILRGAFLTNTNPTLSPGQYLAIDVTMKDKGLAGCPHIIQSITDDAIRLRLPRGGEPGANCVYHNHFEYNLPVYMKDYWKVQSVMGPYGLIAINVPIYHLNAWITNG